MNREFLDLYNRELKILYERSKEFAEEYPGVAERLGGLERRADGPGHRRPARGQRLPGGPRAAQAQERVLRVHGGSARSAGAELPGADAVGDSCSGGCRHSRIPSLAEGGVSARRLSRRRLCRAGAARRLPVPAALRLELWPLSLETAEYYATPAPLQALGLEVAPDVDGRTAARLPASDRAPRHRGAKFAARRGRRSRMSRSTTCPFTFSARSTTPSRSTSSCSPTAADHHPLPRCVRRPAVHRRTAATPAADRFRRGRNAVRARRPRLLRLRTAARLLLVPAQVPRLQAGGLEKAAVADRCAGLRHPVRVRQRRPGWPPVVSPQDVCALHRCRGQSVRDELQPRAGAPRANTNTTSCRTAAACSNSRRTASSMSMRIILVARKRSGSFRSTACRARISAAPDALYYTSAPAAASPNVARAALRRAERLYRHRAVPVAVEPAGVDDTERVRELSVRCAGSNRHLAEQLPVGEAAPISSCSTTPRCRFIALPARHGRANRWSQWSAANRHGAVRRDGVAAHQFPVAQPSRADRPRRRRTGPARCARCWRCSPISRTARPSSGSAASRASPASDRAPAAPEERLRRGARHRDHRTFDEKAFEGVGIFLLGAVLDRFFAEYTSLNSFTETVIETNQRGVIKRWPPRAGAGQAAVTLSRATSGTSRGASTSSRRCGELERSASDKPRIGDSAVAREEVVNLGQDPYPRISRPRTCRGYEDTPAGIPQAVLALPRLLRSAGRAAARHDRGGLHLVERARPSFAALHRHLRQSLPAAVLPRLGGCAADRPARPAGGRSLLPLCRRVCRHRHGQPQRSRQRRGHRQAGLCRAGQLARSRARRACKQLVRASSTSPPRSRSASALAGVRAVRQHGCWARKASRSASTPISAAASTAINDKIRIPIKARDLDEYRSSCRRGTTVDQLTDLFSSISAISCEFDVELLLPARHAPAAQLGLSGELGWTAGSRRTMMPDDGRLFDDARFNALERRRGGRRSRPSSDAAG